MKLNDFGSGWMSIPQVNYIDEKKESHARVWCATAYEFSYTLFPSVLNCSEEKI